jgi:O-palmitoleoyl-L-serine hydrolase
MAASRVGDEQGMISRNGTLNPLWYNANIVWIGYCDGGSFSGALEHPLRVGNDTIYLRGRRVLEAVIRDVVPRTTSAAEVVIKGCSAGGQAAFIHANFLAEQFSHVPRVSVMPGAGFFLDSE